MKIHVFLRTLGAAALLLIPYYAARAQGDSARSDRECRANNYQNGLSTYAETRDQHVSASSSNRIEPGQNGSLMVHGWDQRDVLVRACIQTAAPSDSEARSLAQQVKIARGAGDIQPDGPSEDHSHHWNVSYEVWLPKDSNVDAHAYNGSIALDSVRGQVRFETTNGSVHLDKMAGDVDGSTTNGSVNIRLEGAKWDGHGLRAETTNGSVRLNVPDNYSAKIEASTVNGRVNVDFPITVSGEIGKSLSFQMGSGGPIIEARTTNGSVSVSRN